MSKTKVVRLLIVIGFFLGFFLGLSLALSNNDYSLSDIKFCANNMEWCALEKPELHKTLEGIKQ